MSQKETSCLCGRASVNIPHGLQGVVAILFCTLGSVIKETQGISLNSLYSPSWNSLHLHPNRGPKKPVPKRHWRTKLADRKSRGLLGYTVLCNCSIISLIKVLLFLHLTPGAVETTNPSSRMTETSLVRLTALGTIGNYSFQKQVITVCATWLPRFPFLRKWLTNPDHRYQRPLDKRPENKRTLKSQKSLE